MADGGMVRELTDNPVLKVFSAVGNMLTGKPAPAPAKATGTNFYGYAKDPGPYVPTAAKPKTPATKPATKGTTVSKKAKAPKSPAVAAKGKVVAKAGKAMPKVKNAVHVKPGYPAPKRKK